MAELGEGQQIIFKRKGQDRDSIRVGVHYDGYVQYHISGFSTVMPLEHVTEWCDASEAWNALTLQKSRAGNFEWNEGPTIEPETT